MKSLIVVNDKFGVFTYVVNYMTGDIERTQYTHRMGKKLVYSTHKVSNPRYYVKDLIRQGGKVVMEWAA